MFVIFNIFIMFVISSYFQLCSLSFVLLVSFVSSLFKQQIVVLCLHRNSLCSVVSYVYCPVYLVMFTVLVWDRSGGAKGGVNKGEVS